MLLLLDRVVGTISPHICKNCGKVGATYCDRCIFNVMKRNHPICLLCGATCKSNNLCNLCQRKTKVFDNLLAVGPRVGSMSRLIGDYKYNSEVASAYVIARMIKCRLDQRNGLLSANLVIVPLPTIPAHIRTRGFDHMLLVAKCLSRLIKAPVNNKILDRSDNAVQHTLSASQRRIKAAQSIVLRRRYRSLPDDAIVLLLDDIWTTGSSMTAAAKVLRRAGAKHIVGMAVLYQPKGHCKAVETKAIK